MRVLLVALLLLVASVLPGARPAIGPAARDLDGPMAGHARAITT